MRRWFWVAAAPLAFSACVQTKLIDTPPPTDKPVIYECVYTSMELGGNKRWRSEHPYDAFKADAAAREKCRRYSRSPASCDRLRCNWKAVTPEEKAKSVEQINAPESK